MRSFRKPLAVVAVTLPMVLASCSSNAASESPTTTTSVTTTTNTPAKTTATSIPLPSPSIGKLCGRDFFIPQQFSELERQFGSVSCFGVADQWFIVGNGQQINPTTLPPPPSVGGSIIGVESCNSSDAACLNPDLPHNFSSFTVSYPPDPSSGSFEVPVIVNSHLVNAIDGSCGSFTFDSTTRKWYATTPQSVAELSSGKNIPAAVAAPASASGTVALSSPAPHDNMSSCFKR